MFSTPVVFVIGAGASAEFLMPIGAELKARVASAINFRDATGTPVGDRDLYRLLVTRFTNKTPKYEDAGCDLAKVIPSFVSIDEALNWFTSRPEIIELGKAAIVREILKAERASRLFNAQRPQRIPDAPFDDTWLPHFLSMVMASLNMDEANSAFRNVTLINFNYDRTLEHFLYSALQTKFGLSASSAQGILAGLTVIRPYGTVGPLTWGGGGPSIDFGMELGDDHEKLFSLSNSIRTYTEQETTTHLQAEIQPKLEEARLVVFLGFGFHEQNMLLLRARGAAPWRRAFGTVLGMAPENYPIMRSAIAMTVGCTELPLLLPWQARTLLTDLRPAIMAAAKM